MATIIYAKPISIRACYGAGLLKFNVEKDAMLRFEAVQPICLPYGIGSSKVQQEKVKRFHLLERLGGNGRASL